MNSRSQTYLRDLVRELVGLPHETEWVEFKHNNADPEKIGEYISALSNAAALLGHPTAYLVWGVEDGTHKLVGTSVSPATQKVGKAELETHLLHLLTPKIEFAFYEVDIDGLRFVVLEIEAANRQPVRFKDAEFIRVGSHKTKLKQHPEKERALWRAFDRTPPERVPALENSSDDDVLRFLDYPAYFRLLDVPLPQDRDGILQALSQDKLIRRSDAGGWDILTYGALLLAKELRHFPRLERKAVRVIKYRGLGRLETERERLEVKGYANGFEEVIAYINGLVPANEVIEQALRRSVPMFPELAIREIVANALIHQDLSVTGSGPMIELFDDRLEITNPGTPLVSIERMLDSPPQSRNEATAALMRRFGICEERGSGIDKVAFQIEVFQLPAPLFQAVQEFTKVTLFAHKPLQEMDREERVRACYLHACLRYVHHQHVTNTSIRDRFEIEKRNSSTASRLIKEAIEAGAIAPQDANAAKKSMRYVPFWAAPTSA